MGRTTIARDLIELIRLGKIEKAEILRNLEAGTRGAEQLRRGDPALILTFEQLQASSPPRSSLARGTALGEPTYRTLRDVPMYALTDADRVDVLRFGRHPDQDVQLLGRTVSREHGLVIFGGDVLFCDYGTLRGGEHKGSLNGTYLDGQALIRDTMITWLTVHTLQLGQVNDRFEFRVRYRLLPRTVTN